MLGATDCETLASADGVAPDVFVVVDVSSNAVSACPKDEVGIALRFLSVNQPSRVH